MAYATAQEIVDRYGLDYLLIPSDDNCDGLPDNPKVALALEDATSEINKYLSTRFVVPIQNVDTDDAWKWIKRCCIDLAIYYMAQTWDSMTDLIDKRMQECMAQLGKIADGTINPGGPAVAIPGSFQVCSNPRVLTRKELRGIL